MFIRNIACYKYFDMTNQITWHKPDGSIISCHEKVKVLNENHQELKQLLQDVMDDALLLGCSEANVRNAMQQLIANLHPQVLEQNNTNTPSSK